MPTGPTAWSGPTGWAEMPVTADHSADIFSYPIGWTWSGASGAVGATSGTGVFGFTIFRDVSGTQDLGIDENGNFSARIRYRAIIANPTAITDHTMPRLMIEFYALGWATTNPLPHIGSKMFGSDGAFGTSTNTTTLLYPRVRNIQYTQDNERDPTTWTITYTVTPDRNQPSSTRPGTGDEESTATTEEAPWQIGPETQIQFSTEDFVLGLGTFVATKTPAELKTELESGTYAAAFGATAGTFEMVSNSAGDPLESPPPMKVGTASLTINRAFENLPTGLAAEINAAVEEVCSAEIAANGVTFSAYTCKLNGASIAAKRWKKKADWLPKQLHPMRLTYAELGWVAPTNTDGGDAAVAVNPTRNTLPAFKYMPYYDVSVSIAQRDLGWGYALIDKGYRDKNKGENKSFGADMAHVDILAEGLFIDTSTSTSNQKVLRLYQVLKTGTNLSAVVGAMLGT